MANDLLNKSNNKGFMNSGIRKNLSKMFKLPLYRIFLIICGLPLFAVVGLTYVFHQLIFAKDKKGAEFDKAQAVAKLKESGVYADLEAEVSAQLQKKYDFMKKEPAPDRIASEQKRIVSRRFNEQVLAYIADNSTENHSISDFEAFFCKMLNKPLFFAVSLVLGVFMYMLVLMFSNPYAKFIFERLTMMIFVIFGVTFLVFTILYMSPMDAATNILGPHATPETVAEFNRVHRLDRTYTEQLLGVFRGIVTFDMGLSFVGNEDVISSIFRLFPITLIVAFWSLLLALVIAIPAGIFSAIRPYSAFDYVFMFIALLGLSIPNFWQGLIFILYFSINWQVLPSLYIVGNWLSLVMPVVVLGTALAATVARMTRSSMLEVIKQDYVTTARAKGLPNSKVVLKHVLGNAMIPIVTVVGLTFGGVLGGSAVIERVFNIRGLGSHIVDRQFIPDIPIVMAGTIYIAIIVSITNLIVDVLYAFLDPRIKSQMKNY